MSWQVEVTLSATKDIKKLDTKAQKAVMAFLRNRLLVGDNPRNTGKALRGDLGELWRYRVGDYRIICDIKDNIVTVLVLRVRHRRDVYRK